MIARVTSTYTYLTGRFPAHALIALRDALSYSRKGFQYAWEYKHYRCGGCGKPRLVGAPSPCGTCGAPASSTDMAERLWDGREAVLFQNPPSRGYCVPSGLLPLVLTTLRAEGLTVDVEDTRTLLPVVQAPQRLCGGPNGHPRVLHADQQMAVMTALTHQRGLLELAVNFGKTSILAALCQAYRDRRVIVWVPGTRLLHQTARELSLLLQEPVGQYGDHRKDFHQRVTVVMHQAVAARDNYLKPEEAGLLASADLLLADEVHAVTQATGFPVLAACPAPFRIGMSGSIKEAHSQLVVQAFFGPVHLRVGENELVERGRSSAPTILMPQVSDIVREAGRRPQDYAAQYTDGVVRGPRRNALLTEVVVWAAAQGWPVLLLVYRIEHARTLLAALQQRDVAAEMVWSATSEPAVMSAVKRLLSGRLHAIVASTVFNTGVDLPGLRVLINAAAWRSPLATRQKLGRVLRLVPEGRVLVIDPFDYATKTLKRHAERREALYRSKGFPVHRGLWAELQGVGQTAMAAGPHEVRPAP